VSEDEPRGRTYPTPKPTPLMLLTVGTETSPSSHRLTSGLQSDNRNCDACGGPGGRDNKQALRLQTEKAKALGIFGSPTFVVADELFWGDDRLEDARWSSCCRCNAT